jgi:hypothetical protein
MRRTDFAKVQNASYEYYIRYRKYISYRMYETYILYASEIGGSGQQLHYDSIPARQMYLMTM